MSDLPANERKSVWYEPFDTQRATSRTQMVNDRIDTLHKRVIEIERAVAESRKVLPLLLDKIEAKNSWGKNELKDLILNLLAVGSQVS